MPVVLCPLRTWQWSDLMAKPGVLHDPEFFGPAQKSVQPPIGHGDLGGAEDAHLFELPVDEVVGMAILWPERLLVS